MNLLLSIFGTGLMIIVLVSIHSFSANRNSPIEREIQQNKLIVSIQKVDLPAVDGRPALIYTDTEIFVVEPRHMDDSERWTTLSVLRELQGQQACIVTHMGYAPYPEIVAAYKPDKCVTPED